MGASRPNRRLARDVRFAPGAFSEASDPTKPNIFAALHEQLGLKLTSSKGPVEVLVIDRVERSTAN
jgi:uncharacterized protein (TIGR03435 family)